MMEAPGATKADDAARQKQENTIVATCLITGVSLALGSIPFFRAASKNKAKYRKYITWNLETNPVLLPDGTTKQTVGLSLRFPLFQKTEQRIKL